MKLNISSRIFLYFGLLVLGISGFFFTMFLPAPAGFYAFILVAALGGFGVAANIWHTKSSGKQLVCPTGSNCNVVVNSRFSKFLGISLEYWGMTYFIVILCAYSSILMQPGLLSMPIFLWAVVLLTVGASMFSCYLLFVQAFLLKAWCIWCILAASISLTIFFISLTSLSPVLSVISSIGPFVSYLQFLGYALGLGGSSAAVFLFFHSFLNDNKIEEKELSTLQSISEMVWLGLGITIMSQFASYVADPVNLSSSGTFLVEMIALFGAVVAGALLIIIFAPFLIFVPFKDGKKRSRFATLRRPIFIVGSAAFVSWHFAFAVNFIPEFSLAILLPAYVVILSIGAIVALVSKNVVTASE